MSGTLRILPDFAPRRVSSTTDIPNRLIPSAPPEASIFSTWSRTHPVGLGSYSPVIGMKRIIAGGWGRGHRDPAGHRILPMACDPRREQNKDPHRAEGDRHA